VNKYGVELLGQPAVTPVLAATQRDGYPHAWAVLARWIRITTNVEEQLNYDSRRFAMVRKNPVDPRVARSAAHHVLGVGAHSSCQSLGLGAFRTMPELIFDDMVYPAPHQIPSFRH
jgi:hypothetical protein